MRSRPSQVFEGGASRHGLIRPRRKAGVHHCGQRHRHHHAVESSRAEGEGDVRAEKGGIALAIGLDTGRPGQTDDATFLDDGLYVRRWIDYVGVAPAFDIACEITVAGTAIR